MNYISILMLFFVNLYAKPFNFSNFTLQIPKEKEEISITTQTITFLENSYEEENKDDIKKILNWRKIVISPDKVAEKLIKKLEKETPDKQKEILKRNEEKIGYLILALDRINSEYFDDVLRISVSHEIFINPYNFLNFKEQAINIMNEYVYKLNKESLTRGSRGPIISTATLNYDNVANKIVEFARKIKEDPSRALDIAKKITVNQSTNTSLNNGISRILMDEGKYREAEYYLSKSIEVDHNNYDAYTMRAEARYSLKDIKGAIEDIKRASEIDPTNETTKLLSSFLAKNSGFSSTDISYIKNSFADGSSLSKENVSEFKVGERKESSVVDNSNLNNVNSEFAVTENEKKSNYYLKIGISKSEMKDYNEALKYLNMAIEKNPDNLNAYIERANVYNLIGKYDEAIKDTTYVLMHDPTNIIALNIRAFSMYKKGNISEAFNDTNKAIEIKPSYADAIFLRALLYEKQNKYEEMLSDLEKAAKLNSNYVPYFHDALSSYAMQTKSFIRYYERNKDLFKITKDEGEKFNLKRFLVLLGLTVLGGIFIGISLLHVFSPKFTTHTASISTSVSGDIITPNIFYEGVASGKYKIIKKLGQGGMGSVYLAIDQTLNREVAIKKMNDREKQRFIEEARTVAMLHHPNIIEIYTIFEEKGDLYLVFEYIDGITLDKKLDKEVRMIFDDVKYIVNEISKALSYAHLKGIVHRDLKLSNVMISKEGFVKVMDFGLAKVVREAKARQSSSEIVGSPAYMAPEQDNGMFFKESDLYSLGVCIYEMLAGELPFSGPDYHYQKEKKLYTPLLSIVVGLPKKLDDVISKLLEPDPNNRYHSVEEFIKDFNSL
jgi:tetratricopeptide (TPR) repeat protein